MGTIELRGTGSDDWIWNGPCSAMKSQVTMPGIIHKEQQMFQVINAMVNTKDAAALAQVNNAYCRDAGRVDSYTGALAFGRIMTAQLYMFNEMNVPLKIKDYYFKIYMHVPPSHEDGTLYSDAEIQDLVAKGLDPYVLEPFAYVGPHMRNPKSMEVPAGGYDMKVLDICSWKPMLYIEPEDAQAKAAGKSDTSLLKFSKAQVGGVLNDMHKSVFKRKRSEES